MFSWASDALISSSLDTAQDMRSRIVDAATERFRHYGYGKTTMAEIARDCDMSAGNLYRYFESKSDIGAAVSTAWFSALQQAVRHAVAKPGLSARDQLEAYVLGLAEFTLETCRDSPHIQEMVDFLCEERRDLLENHMSALNVLVAEIIAAGNERGEFAAKDVNQAARAFQIACTHFQYPPLLTLMDEECLAADARAVVDLVVMGLNG